MLFLDIKFPKVSGVETISKIYNNKKESSNKKNQNRKYTKKDKHINTLEKEILFSDEDANIEEEMLKKPRLDDYI